MRIVLWLLACSVLLVGCSTTWNHTAKDETEFYADDSECVSRAEGVPYNPYGGTNGALMRRVQVTNIYERCMMGRGWTKAR